MHSNFGHDGKYPFLAIFFLFDNTQKVHLGLKGYRGVIIIVLALAAFRLGYLYDKRRRLKDAFFFRLQDDLRRKFVKSSFDDRRLYTERPRRLLRDAILMLSKVC